MGTYYVKMVSLIKKIFFQNEYFCFQYLLFFTNIETDQIICIRCKPNIKNHYSLQLSFNDHGHLGSSDVHKKSQILVYKE
jgi:hypothetical protein